MTNYDAIFGFEHSQIINNVFFYTVYRKNSLALFRTVAKVEVFPNEHIDVHLLSPLLSCSERVYIRGYFNDLVNLKIRPSADSNFSYVVYRKAPSGSFDIVASFDGYELTAVKHLKPHESAYLDAYFKNLLN